MSAVYVSAENLSEAWAKTLLAVATIPGRKAFHTVTRISDLTVEDARVRGVADHLLASADLPAVNTVANTIFPAGLAAQEPNPAALGDRYMKLLPRLRELDHENSKGTYFQRLVAYPGPSGSQINQVEELVRRIRVELDTRGPKSARYEVGVDGPSTASPILEPERDRSSMGFPCLSLLSFQLENRTRVSAVAHYRSQYMMQRGYGNYLGIARLIQYIATAAGIQVGQLTVVAGHACADHITRTDLEMVRIALTERQPGHAAR